MLAHGVDMLGAGGMLSSAHGPQELERTVTAFTAAIRDLASEGLLTEA
jgi:hypothetical protein